MKTTTRARLRVLAGAACAAACTGAAAATWPVSTAAELIDALARVEPGDTITLAPGTYRGSFTATRSGAKDRPITLAGPADAVLTNSGYGFHLQANYWKLTGFTVAHASKGIVLDRANHNLLDALTVHDIDDEGIHFRVFSSDNVLRGSHVHDTGLGTPGFGEAIYVGSANSNWGSLTGGKPDTSDRNCIANNTIGPGVAAEGIDIKEGTRDGIVVGNRYDATGISGENYADSFLDAKGNAWLIYGNVVDNPGHTHVLVDGFQTHQQLPGYGDDNTFEANTVDLESTGYGFNVASATSGNRVCDDNHVSSAGSGFANVTPVRCGGTRPKCPKVLDR